MSETVAVQESVSFPMNDILGKHRGGNNETDANIRVKKNEIPETHQRVFIQKQWLNNRPSDVLKISFITGIGSPRRAGGHRPGIVRFTG